MKKIVLLAVLAIVSVTTMNFSAPNGGGYAVGDQAKDFKLKNIDGKMVSMADYKKAKGFIVVFTCNHCPYAKAYEERIMALDKKYAAQGYPVIAINPNDPERVPDDSPENMAKRAQEKGYSFPYLFDETQKVAKTFGATRTPHVYILSKKDKGLTVEYIGAIDDNTESAEAVEEKYVENAIAAIEKGEKPTPASTKAIGCTIKWR